MKDFFDTISASLRDRFSSPLMSSFLLSWPVWNYKFILVFFSDMKPYVKFSYISSQIYPDAWHGLIFGLLGPIFTALFYVGFYPFIIHVAEFVSNWHKVRLERQRIKHGDETPLSEERAKELWQEFRRSVKSYEQELDEGAVRIKNLKADLTSYEQRLAEASKTEHDLRVALVNEKASSDVKDQKYSELKGKHSDLNDMFKLEVALRRELEQEKHDLEGKIEAGEKEIERLVVAVRERSAEAADYEKNKSMFVTRMEFVQQDNNNLKDRVKALEVKSLSKDAEIGRYKKIIEDLRSGVNRG